MKKCLITILGVILASLLLACKPEGASSPERAVYLKIRQNQAVLTRSIQVQPAVRFRDSYFILSSFNLNPETQNSKDLGEHCTRLYELSHIESKWEIFGGSLTCSSNPFRDVFSISTGVGLTTHTNLEDKYSYVAVETVIEDAVWVDITWEDGRTQRVPVVNEYFLALREGAFYPILFVVLNENEEEVYTTTFDPPS